MYCYLAKIVARLKKKQDATKKSSSNVTGSSLVAEVTNRDLFGYFDEENSDSRVELVETIKYKSLSLIKD